jgi:hypothetical protein
MVWWQQPFFQVALPIIVTFAIATWFQSKRIDDLRDSLGRRLDSIEASINRRLDGIDARLARIESLFTDHDRRITALEERTSPLRR